MHISRRNDTSPVLAAGDLVLDTCCRSLSGPSGNLKLDASSYLILRTLLSQPGNVFSMSQLIEAMWPDPALEPEENPERVVRQRIYRARWAMAQVGVAPRRLVAQRTEGYGLLGAHTIGRAFSPANASAIDRIVALRPDLPVLATELEHAAAQRSQIAA